jgi:CHC2 zinc finger
MRRAQFDSTENAKLRAKIDEAKPRLPMPELLQRLELGAHAKKSARCMWHDDQHPSFSVFKGRDGFWHYKCFVCDPQGGDEISFLAKHFNISRREAIKRYLDMADFPAGVRNKSREYPKSPDSPRFPESLSVLVSESPCVSVSHVSNGQGLDGEKQRLLKSFAARNACTRAGGNADRKRFKLARDVRAVEKGIGRELSIDELMISFDEWHRLSQPFLDPAKTCDDYWIAFLAELEKVRVPTGEGALTKALEKVSKLSLDQLPLIPGYANAPENCRRLVGLHRELSGLSANGTYFLSYRDAAKVCEELSHQEAHTITSALVRLRLITIVRKGKAGLNSGEAAEFRYLLPRAEFPGEKDDEDECPF